MHKQFVQTPSPCFLLILKCANCPEIPCANCAFLRGVGFLGGSRQRGVENPAGGGGNGEHTVKPLPKHVFGPPPPTIRFPPFFGDSLSFPLKGKRHRPDQPQFLRPPKVVLESTLCSTLPPHPQTHVIRFSPPPCRLTAHAWVRTSDRWV